VTRTYRGKSIFEEGDLVFWDSVSPEDMGYLNRAPAVVSRIYSKTSLMVLVPKAGSGLPDIEGPRELFRYYRARANKVAHVDEKEWHDFANDPDPGMHLYKKRRAREKEREHLKLVVAPNGSALQGDKLDAIQGELTMLNVTATAISSKLSPSMLPELTEIVTLEVEE